MNPYVLVYLAGNVGSDLLIVGAFPDLATAEAAQAATTSPFNYQVCKVWQAQLPPPPFGTPLAPYVPAAVTPGAWLAIAPGNSPNGGLQMFGYGTFSSKQGALAWARAQENPSAFSFGVVQAAP